MKFWVKAVTDTASEQLFVDASSLDELRSQLQALLHCGPIVRMSITDFKSEVTTKLSDGADIINVRVETAPMLATTGLGASAVDEHRRVSPRPARRLSGSIGSMGNDVRESSLGATGGVSIFGTSPVASGAAGGPLSSPGSATGGATGGGGAGTPNSANNSAGRLHRTNSGSGRSMLDPTSDHPVIERIVIKRADLALLIDATFSSAFNDVVSGCFVRIREAAFGGSDSTGYILAQVAGVHSTSQVLVDLVHYVELRHLDVVSNAAPSADEVRAWFRKMIASSRVVPNPVYVEAKAEALDAAMRTVTALQTPTPPSAGLAQQSPANSLRRRATLYNLQGALQQQAAQASGAPPLAVDERPIIGKAINGNTNDMFLNCCVCRTNDTNQWCVFAARRSNAKAKHTRTSDFSCALFVVSNDFSTVIEDRDVSFKGFAASVGPPQLWNGYFIMAAHAVTDALCHGSQRNFNAATSDYVALIGRDIKAMFNTPMKFQLPRVPWAVDADLALPQLLVLGDTLHLFYLASFVDSANGMRVEGLVHATTRDPKLQAWDLVSQTAPLVKGFNGVCFHASTVEFPASPGGPAATTGLRVLFCSQGLEDSPHVVLLQNSDSGYFEGRWTPVPCVCSIPQGEWRSSGVQSIAVFATKDGLFAAVNGEENHRHSTLLIVPLVMR